MSGFELKTSLDVLRENTGRVFLAYSGGLDSSVLLHLLCQQKHSDQIILWHVNHGLQPNASEMQRFCQQQAHQSGFPLKINQLDLPDKTANLEAVTRELRYQIFAEELCEKDIVLTAHHADDQLETFLLNMLRASGTKGLRGIAAQRPLGKGRLIRPLLMASKSSLEQYANEQKLDWVDDPSNSNEDFSRNFLRHHIVPNLKSRWPSCQLSVVRACQLQNESHELLKDLAAIDYKTLADEQNRLLISNLKDLSQARQRNVIRFWLDERGCKLLPYSKMNNLLQQLGAKFDACPIIEHQNYQLRIHRGYVYCLNQPTREKPAAQYQLHQQQNIQVNPYIPYSTRADLFADLNQQDQGQSLSFRFRVGPSRPNADNHKLKRLFQQKKIPPWDRPYTPQLYLDDQLITLLQHS